MKEWNMALRSLEKRINSFKEIELLNSEFEDRIFMIKSCGISEFKKAYKQFVNLMPKKQIIILIKKSEEKDIIQFCRDTDVVMMYDYYGNYKLDLLKNDIDIIKKQGDLSVIIFYNNRLGMGYENIEIIANYVSCDITAYNSEGKFLKIIEPECRLASEKLYREIMKWYDVIKTKELIDNECIL